MSMDKRIIYVHLGFVSIVISTYHIYNLFFRFLLLCVSLSVQGDSGGPLQCRLTKNGPWLLAGITSFGSGCAIEGYPDVYVRTSYYMKWIQDTIAYE